MFFYLPDKLQLDAYQTYNNTDKLSVSSIIKEYFLAEKITERITVFQPDRGQVIINSLYDLDLDVTYELKLRDYFPNAHFYLTRTQYNKMTFRLHCTPPPERSSQLQNDDDNDGDEGCGDTARPPEETLDCTVEDIELQCLKGEVLEFCQKVRMQFDENSVNVKSNANASAASKAAGSSGGSNKGGGTTKSATNGGSGDNTNGNSGSDSAVSVAAVLDYSYGFVDGTFYVTNFRCVFVPYKFVNTSKLVFQDMRYSGVVVGNTVLNTNYTGTCVYNHGMAEPEALSCENEGWIESLHLKNRPIWFPIRAISKLHKGNPPVGFIESMWKYLSFAQTDPDADKVLRIVLSPYYRCTLYGTFFFIFENDVLCSSAHKAVGKGMLQLNNESFPLKFGGLEKDNGPKECPIRDFDVKKEFEREGLVFDDESEDGDDKKKGGAEGVSNFAHKWRITTVNQNYGVTQTYQKTL